MTHDFPLSADVDMLGLEFTAGADGGDGPNRCCFELTPRIGRHDGTLYGGAAIAVSVVAMEAASNRPALWVTTQFVSTAQQGDTIECTAEVLANGRNISQVQVTGRLGERILFVSLGSTATPRADGMEGQFQTMPAMTAPDESPTVLFGDPKGFRGFLSQVEYREAKMKDGAEGGPPLALWARLSDGKPMTRAAISFVADMVPGGIAREANMIGGGISLDNSLRFGALPSDVEWVLLEMRAHMASGAHAHGSVAVWSPEGDLLAVGGQSANMARMVSPEEYGFQIER